MSLTLSSVEVARLQTALAAVAAPLAYADISTWRRAMRAATEPLVGAFESLSWFPLAGEPVAQMAPHSAVVLAHRQEYFAGGSDPGIERLRRLKPAVAAHAQLYPPDDPRVRAFHYELVLPLGLQHGLYLATDIGAPQPAALILHLPGDASAAQIERGLALLRLLHPAYAAGVQTCVRLARHRSLLGRLVDALADGVALCTSAGRVTHRNASLTTLLGTDAEAPRLEAEVTRVAASVGALAEQRQRGGKAASDGSTPESLLRELRTAVGRYRLYASYAGRDLLGPDAAVLVLVARLEVPELSAVQLRTRFGLTPREVEVAYLLARGRSNGAVARLLALSPATARHYTEHTLAKLGLHSRAQVAARLREGSLVARSEGSAD